LAKNGPRQDKFVKTCIFKNGEISHNQAVRLSRAVQRAQTIDIKRLLWHDHVQAIISTEKHCLYLNRFHEGFSYRSGKSFQVPKSIKIRCIKSFELNDHIVCLRSSACKISIVGPEVVRLYPDRGFGQ
jgi:hypothetical protein